MQFTRLHRGANSLKKGQRSKLNVSMNRRQYLGHTAGILSLVMSGCGYVPEGDTVHVTLVGEEGTTPAEVALNPITVSESQIQVEGRLAAENGKLNKEMYRDVAIQLYSESGQPICSQLIGDWEGDTRPISFSTETIPTYVIIYSPDFWDEPMAVEYFIHDRDRDLFVPEEATTRAELPVDEIQTGIPSCTE